MNLYGRSWKSKRKVATLEEREEENEKEREWPWVHMHSMGERIKPTLYK